MTIDRRLDNHDAERLPNCIAGQANSFNLTILRSNNSPSDGNDTRGANGLPRTRPKSGAMLRMFRNKYNDQSEPNQPDILTTNPGGVMNIDNINTTIALLERIHELECVGYHGLFNMNTWGESLPSDVTMLEQFIENDVLDECNSTGCIAGWATVAGGLACNGRKIADAAQDWLELKDTMADYLFTPPSIINARKITTIEAAEALRLLVEHETFEWTHVLPSTKVDQEVDI